MTSNVDDSGAVTAVNGLRSSALDTFGIGGGGSTCCVLTISCENDCNLGGEGIIPLTSPSARTLSIPSLDMRGICGVINPACNAGNSYLFQKNIAVWTRNNVVDASDA